MQLSIGMPILQSARSQFSPPRSNRLSTAVLASLVALVLFWAIAQSSHAHSGLVDGYGCHRGSDKVSYHCHEGEFVGRTFKSKEDFLRRLRQGKAEQLTPRGNADSPAPPKKKIED